MFYIFPNIFIKDELTSPIVFSPTDVSTSDPGSPVKCMYNKNLNIKVHFRIYIKLQLVDECVLPAPSHQGFSGWKYNL
mgnify:CR=1 FL=1